MRDYIKALNENVPGPMMILMGALIVSILVIAGWFVETIIPGSEVNKLRSSQIEYYHEHSVFLPDSIVRDRFSGSGWIKLIDYRTESRSWEVIYRSNLSKREMKFSGSANDP